MILGVLLSTNTGESNFMTDLKNEDTTLFGNVTKML
jgi:hypothetical protein